MLVNAGIGSVGAFEAMPMRLIRQLIETNTIGVMAMCQAFIPQMRVLRRLPPSPERHAGAFAGGAYRRRQAAIAGFTASLAHELGYLAFAPNSSSRATHPPRVSGPMPLCP
jgi:NAD(P)-dependent dehydrogenase (short-subunit alcohol dehydrogenase family)